MFIISEMGAFIKMIVAFIGYLLFLPVNLLDTYVFSKLFEGEFISTSVSFVILLFLLFFSLGIASKNLPLCLIFGVIMLILYLLLDFVVGFFFVVLLMYLVNTYYFYNKERYKTD